MANKLEETIIESAALDTIYGNNHFVQPAQPKIISYEEYLDRLAKASGANPFTFGLHRALTSGEPLSDYLSKYLKECYELHLSIRDVVEDWF